MSWQPATLEEVLRALAEEKSTLDNEYFFGCDRFWVEPYAAVVNRLGEDGQVFVVARSSTHIIFFEDIEENFCLARETDDRLWDVIDFGHLGPALIEMRRLEGG